jgi:NAD(P)H dehydrogenase (quinone)
MPHSKEHCKMATNILVTFYSTYGHVHRMALGARQVLSADDAYVRAQKAQADIPEVTHDDLCWAEGTSLGGRRPATAT